MGEDADHEPGGDDARNQNQEAEQKTAPNGDPVPRLRAPARFHGSRIWQAVAIRRERIGGANRSSGFEDAEHTSPPQSIRAHRPAGDGRDGTEIAVPTQHLRQLLVWLTPGLSR
jgi:hypothetical protein